MEANMSYQIFDSDWNDLGEPHDNLDSALHAAGKLVCDTWQDWERATICFIFEPSVPDAPPVEIVTVERFGPRGTTRVRIALAEAGWVAWTSGDR
jgi:hypothetical protein